MKTKVAIAVSAALMSVSVSSIAALHVSVKHLASTPAQIHPINSKKSTPIVKISTHSVFTPEANLAAGNYRYFVRLKENPVALYRGSIAGYKATSPAVVKTANHKLNMKSAAVKAYRSFLMQRQNDVIQQATKVLGHLNVKQQTTLAYNGLVVKMSQADAIKLAMVPGISYIHREIKQYIQTDSGPSYIKAPGIWDGSASGVASKGEGMIVGIIDTGVNTDNASFADIGGDGYDHTNPLGSGTYLGDCASDAFASLCNDKLIGVFSYPLITDQYPTYAKDVPANGEDHNGHGSHTASTTAGNVLKNVDAGNGVVFDQISGVAPHANIISYQVCTPGEQDAIGFGGCYPSLTVLAIENAIENGVDAINYSIGGGSTNPWESADSIAFLSARQAGINVAVAAGNDGPNPETVGSPGDSPWVTTVAAATDDRKIIRNVSFNDKMYHYARSTGPALTATVSAPLVYAGTIDANNMEGCTAFAADSFKDSMALISRGSCTFADKVTNATAAGATSVIVFNNKDGDATITMSGLESTTIPSVMISQNSGAEFVAALSTTPMLVASIDPKPSIEHSGGGVLAGFSSRGPNKSVPDVIAPSITAPGVNIFAAYANDQPVGFKENPDPSNNAFLSGTSMATPHMTGALTLLSAVHPKWSPAEVQSALMLTGDQKVMKADGVTPADFFDMGAGYADVSAAAATGLVMDENFADYMKADPSMGGMPSSINLPSMASANCVDTCTWTRTVTATKAGTWTTSSMPIAEAFTVTVSPASFTLVKGATQVLTITGDVSAAPAGWNMANVVLTSAEGSVLKMPVAAKASGNNFPNNFAVTAHRVSGEITFPGLKTKDLVDVTAAVYDKTTLLYAPIQLSVPENDLDYTVVTFDKTVPNVAFSITASTAPDVDLRILDSNFTKIGSSAGPTAIESVSFTNLPAGTYYVVVDGYQASTPGGTDPVTVEISSILTDASSLSTDFSANIAKNNNDFDLSFAWTADTAKSGIIALTGTTGKSVQIPFNFTRGADDVTFTASKAITTSMTPGLANPVTFNIAPNFTNEDKVYTLSATVSDAAAQEITNSTTSDKAVINGNTMTWTITRKVGESAEMLPVILDFIPRKAGSDYQVTFTQALNGDSVSYPTQTFSVVEVPPMAMITAPSTVGEESVFKLNGDKSNDANGDALTYAWTQISGPVATYSNNAKTIDVTSPKVSQNEIISFQLTVTDTQGNTNSTITAIQVINSKRGGSFGWLLLSAPLLWLRRKAVK